LWGLILVLVLHQICSYVFDWIWGSVEMEEEQA